MFRRLAIDDGPPEEDICVIVAIAGVLNLSERKVWEVMKPDFEKGFLNSGVRVGLQRLGHPAKDVTRDFWMWKNPGPLKKFLSEKGGRFLVVLRDRMGTGNGHMYGVRDGNIYDADPNVSDSSFSIIKVVLRVG